jgi:hypothetical protein
MDQWRVVYEDRVDKRIKELTIRDLSLEYKEYSCVIHPICPCNTNTNAMGNAENSNNKRMQLLNKVGKYNKKNRIDNTEQKHNGPPIFLDIYYNSPHGNTMTSKVGSNDNIDCDDDGEPSAVVELEYVGSDRKGWQEYYREFADHEKDGPDLLPYMFEFQITCFSNDGESLDAFPVICGASIKLPFIYRNSEIYDIAHTKHVHMDLTTSEEWCQSIKDSMDFNRLPNTVILLVQSSNMLEILVAKITFKKFGPTKRYDPKQVEFDTGILNSYSLYSVHLKRKQRN